MQQYSRGESRYVTLFREFQEFDSQLGRVEKSMNDAFKEFDELQKATIRQSDSIRILKENWADEAFAGRRRGLRGEAAGLGPQGRGRYHQRQRRRPDEPQGETRASTG